MAEQIGLTDAAGTTATDPTPSTNDAETFNATGSPGTPFIHGRDYVVDSDSYRHTGTADHSRVLLTYRLWGEPIKSSNNLPTGDTVNGSTAIINCTFVPTGAACLPGSSCVGMRITGPGIPPDTFIAATNGSTTLTISRAATATASTVALAINSRYVGKVREWKFVRQMLGYPYKGQNASTGQLVLQRNLPEPLRWADNRWTYIDGRRFLAVTATTVSGTTAMTVVKKIVDGVSVDGALATPDLAGATIYGPGIAVGTTISARVSDTALTLSLNATASGTAKQFLLFFPTLTTNRFTHWCTNFGNVRGGAPKAQKQNSTPAMYPGTANGVPPEPQFEYLDIDFTFEQLPYECRFANDVAVMGASLAYGGEWSRFTIYPEESSARLLQIRGGAFWDQSTSGFGQSYFSLSSTTTNASAVVVLVSTANLGPGMAVSGAGIQANSVILTVDSATNITLSLVATASATVTLTFNGLVSGSMFAAKEGLPKTIGENCFTWRWMDVPMWGYDWNYIQTHFGQINSADFGTTYTAPFYVIPKECALFETCQRLQKNNIFGEPLWDLTFFFRSTALDDRKGYWNRLFNNMGFLQRYKVGNQDFFKSFDFANLFKPYGWTS